MNVSDQIIKILAQVGVKQIFGIPGDTIDSMMESLRNQNDIEFIIMRHEEAGAFAASAQAKLTGNLAVCVACQGPGSIHLLNGLYDAALDRVPVLAITGQVESSLIGTRMPQEINQLTLFSEVAVYNQEIRTAENLPRVLTLACRAALNKRGVAHISVPADIMRLPAFAEQIEEIIAYESKIYPTKQSIDKIATLINKAERVSILYGGGAANAREQLVKLSTHLKAPLIHTTRSKDIIDNRLDNYVGGIGLMGTESGNKAATECDLLLVVGSSFAFKDFYPKKAEIVQIDNDSSRLGARVPITAGVLADCDVALNELLEVVQPKPSDKFLKEIQASKIKRFDANLIAQKANDSDKYVNPHCLMEHVSKLASEDAIYCVGTGTSTIYCNNYLQLNGKQRFLWTWNLASLGWGLPAALGCKLAEPSRQVIAPMGDGDFQMLISDFITLVKYELPVIFIVFNNSCYRFIELEEAGEGNPPFGTELLNPDYVKLAEAHGGMGIKIMNNSEIEEALKAAFASKVPTIVDVHTCPHELFIPPKITAKMAVNFMKSEVKGWGL